MPVGMGSTIYSFTIPLIGIVTNTHLHMRVFLGEPPSAGGSLSSINPPCSAKWGESCDYYLDATCTDPVITVSPASPSVCGATGSIALTASGAGATPTYLWSPATGLSATTGATVTATPGTTSTYTVTGYGPGVCLATTPVTVTVNPLVTPVITPGGPTTFCNGGSVTLSETSGTGTFYQWYSGSSLVTGATNSSFTVSPTATTTYSVSVTSAAGCTGSAAVTVTVLSNPTPVITPGGPTSFCAGGSVALTETSGTGTFYLWYSGASAIVGATTNTYVASPPSTTTYSVVVTTAGGCTGSASITVTVLATPAPVITPGGPTSFCPGGSVTLTETSGTGTLYQWYSGTSPITGATTNTYTSSPAATTIYSVLVTSSAGCTAGVAVTVTVLANPVPVITPDGPTTFCLGGSVTLTETSGTGTAYQWYSGTTLIAGATTNTYTAAPAATTTYSLLVTSSGGCTGSASVTITVVTNPTPVITPGGPLAFCAGGSVNLSETSGTASFYQWYAAGSPIAGATNSTYNASPVVTTTYSVSASNSGGCTGGASITVTVFPLPGSAITPIGPTTVCFPATVLLNATAGAGYSYEWYNSGIIISGATGQSFTATASGIYNVSITTANGCKDTSTAVSITINPKPVASATASGPLTFCSDDSVVLTAAAAAGYTYQWMDGTMIIPGATTVSYTATVVGTHDYVVIVTNSSGCSDTTATGVFTVTVNPVPVSVITASGPLSFCDGGSVTLSVPFVTGYSYQWYYGTTVAGATVVTGATSAALTATATGYYYVDIITPFGCKSASVPLLVTNVAIPYIQYYTPLTFCWGSHASLSLNISSSATGITYQWMLNSANIPGATSTAFDAYYAGVYTCLVNVGGGGCITTTAPVTVVVNPLPDPLITYGGGYLKTWTFYTSYQWYQNFVPISGANLYRYPPQVPADYGVIVTDTNGCVSAATNYPLAHLDTIINITGVSQVTGITEPVIYPNPATSKLFIQYSKKVGITITGIDNRVMLEVASANEIDITSLPCGVYIISLYDENKNRLLVKKLVKQ